MVDWEVREERLAIATSLLSGMMARDYHGIEEFAVERAIRMADLLIKEVDKKDG